MSLTKKVEKKAGQVKVKSKLEDAQELIDKSKKDRAEKFLKALEALKKEYDCETEVHAQITGSVAQSIIVVIPK